mgnify:CR=1 FL=1
MTLKLKVTFPGRYGRESQIEGQLSTLKEIVLLVQISPYTYALGLTLIIMVSRV